jgi:hypothetical protein
MQRREGIDGRGCKGAVIDEPHRKPHVLAQRARELRVEIAHDEYARRFARAEACACAHDCGCRPGRRGEKALALLGAGGDDVAPR